VKKPGNTLYNIEFFSLFVIANFDGLCINEIFLKINFIGLIVMIPLKRVWLKDNKNVQRISKLELAQRRTR